MADPVIGTLLYAHREGYPAFVQPGGPGTPVFPSQPPTPQPPTEPPWVGPPQEHLGRFFPNCGHSIMSWEVASVTLAGAPALALICPLCSFIENLYQPPSLLNQQEFILG